MWNCSLGYGRQNFELHTPDSDPFNCLIEIYSPVANPFHFVLRSSSPFTFHAYIPSSHPHPSNNSSVAYFTILIMTDDMDPTIWRYLAKTSIVLNHL